MELTQRERQILRLVAEGFTDGQIAAELSCSYSWIVEQKRVLREKLEVNGNAGLTRIAVYLGIVPIKPKKH